MKNLFNISALLVSLTLFTNTASAHTTGTKANLSQLVEIDMEKEEAVDDIAFSEIEIQVYEARLFSLWVNKLIPITEEIESEIEPISFTKEEIEIFNARNIKASR